MPLTAASLTPGSLVTGETTVWTVSLTTSLALGSDGLLEVNWPYWNAVFSPNSGQQVSMITTATPVCTGTQGLTGALTCSFSSSTNSLSVSLPGAAAGKIAFTLDSVKNPPSTSTITSFTLKTRITDGTVQDSSGLTLSVHMTTPNLLALSVSASPKTINSLSSFDVKITPTNPLPVDAVLVFTFPTQIPISSSQLTVVTGKFGVKTSPLQFTLSGQSVRVTNSLNSYYLEGNLLWLSLSLITTPSSTQPTDVITAYTTMTTGELIDKTSPGVSFTSTPGSITNVTITPKVLTINANTYYQFKLTVKNPVPETGGIKITAPSQVTPVNVSEGQCFQVEEGLKSGTLCRIEQSKYIYIYNCFVAGYVGDVIVDVSGILNPQTVNPTDNFSIQTYTTSGFQYVIEENLSAGYIRATSDSLVSVTITPSSLVTGSITTYTVSITTKNKILRGGYVTVVFPSDVTRDDPTTPCTNVAGFEPSMTCDELNDKVTVTSGFVNNDFPPGVLTFSIDKMRNPQTTKKSGTFSVGTYTSTGGLYDSKTDNIFVTMTTPNQLYSVSISPNSNIVSATADLTFYIQPNNPMVSNGVVQVTFPTEVSLPNPPSCVIAGLVTTRVTCNVISGQLHAQVTFASSSTVSQFGFTLQGVTNPGSTKPTSSFSVLTTVSTYYLIDTMTSGITYSVSLPATIAAEIKQANAGISQETTYTFTMTLKNPVPAGGYVVVELPPQVSIVTSNLTCSFLGNSVTCTNIGSNSIKISLFPSDFNASQIVFAVSGIKNSPTVGTSGAFKLTSKTSGGYLIDQSGDQTVSFSCSSPCLTCDTLPSRCTSCPSASSTPYLYDYGCHDACKTGYVDLGDKNCVGCDPTCYTCFGSKSSCRSCFTNGALPYLSNYSCVSQCPGNTMVTTDLQCLTCSTTCKTCAKTATTCTSCVYPKKLYVESCVDACPPATMEVGGTDCLNCDPSCATCASLVTQCTSCPAGKLLYKGKCVDSCLPDVSIVVGQQCQDCDPSCKTCSGTVTTCRSCQTGSVLVGSECLNQCPTGTTAINGVCQNCVSGCTSCNGSADNCTGCDSHLYLFGSNCVSDCPAQTSIKSGSNCYACDSNCATCVNSVSNCASCSAGKLLYQGKCVDSCLAGVTVVVGAECFNCDASCQTCSGSVSHCASCYSGFSLLGSACISQCPSTHTSVNGVCVVCSPSCLTCQGAANACSSCPGSQFLYQSTCVQACPVGQSITMGSICQPCASTCLTCTQTPTTCDTCPQGLYLLQSQCVTSCPAKYVTLGGVCAACDPSCLDCKGTTSACTSCSAGYYLEAGSCLRSCPSNKPIPSGQTCLACESPCVGCVSTTQTCTTCISGKLLLGDNCVDTCPSGYEQLGSTCQMIPPPTECSTNCTSALLSNSLCDIQCNTTACNYDNGLCSYVTPIPPIDNTALNRTASLYTSTLQYTSHPLPASSIALLLAVVLLGTKLFIHNTVLTTAVTGVWSVVETCAWGVLCYYVYTEDFTHGEGRRLLDTENSEVLSLFILILVFFMLHLAINIAFSLYYILAIAKHDKSHQEWREQHYIGVTVLIFLSTFISFKLFRLIYSGLFGLKICLTSFDHRRSFFLPILILTYLSLICTTVPFICLCIYAMVIYSTGNLVFIVALDTLTITMLNLLITIGDIVYVTHVVTIEKYNLNLTAVALPMQTTAVIDTTTMTEILQKEECSPPHSARSHDPFDGDMFVQEYVHGTEAMPAGVKDVSFDNLGEDPDDKERTYSAVEPEGEQLTTPNRLETFETESKDLTDRFSFESTHPQLALRLSDQPPSEEVHISQEDQGLEEVLQSQMMEMTRAPQAESTAEGDLFTPADYPSSGEESGIAIHPDSPPSFEHEPQLLDTIPEESALELDSAEIDEYDSDCIKVPLKPSGIKVLVKKSFDGAIPVSEDGQELPDAQPVSIDADSEVEVDRHDVRFGTLRKSNSEGKVRVKRSFRGAKIMDIETCVQGEKRWLVGRTASIATDFDFSSAQPDPQSPDTVIVSHMLSGHKVRIQKPETSSESPSVQDLPRPIHYEYMGGRIVEVLPQSEDGSFMLYQLPVFSTPQNPRSLFSTRPAEEWPAVTVPASPPPVQPLRIRNIKSSNAKTRKNRFSRSSSRSSSISREDSAQRIYGLENAGLSEESSGVIQVHPRKKSKQKKNLKHQPQRRSLKSLEEIYLQRLETPGQNRRGELRVPVFNPFFNTDVVDEDSLSRPSNSPEAQYLNTQRMAGELGLEVLRGVTK